jgi:hypothetical protein
MAQSYLQRVADELADLALADQDASGDIGIVDLIGDVLGASSQTLQETYLTSIRVRRAETRAREMLSQRKANNYVEAPKPKAAPLQGVSEDVEEALDEADAKTDEQAEEAPPTTPPGGMPRRVTR